MGALGGFTGVVLTVPPAVYLLTPTIKTNILGHSDVPSVWRELDSVFEIPESEIKTDRIEFPQKQTYQQQGSIANAVMVSWRDGKMPEVLKQKSGDLSQGEISEVSSNLNVFSNSCAHLGCPVRWFPDKHQILCPCHGGIYDINGDYVGGPPPRGLYHYIFEVREDGIIRIKHEFQEGKPYVY